MQKLTRLLGLASLCALAALAKTGSLAISPGSLTFPNTTVGQTSVTQTITVKNTSTAHVAFASVGTFGPFPVTSNTCRALNPNGKCTVTIAFKASSAGFRTGTLVFNDDAYNSPQVISLSGTGVDPAPPPIPDPTPVNGAPLVFPGSNQSVTLPAAATLSATVTDDGLPAGSTLREQWSVVSGGAVSFSNAASTATSASFAAAGTYVLRLTATDGALSTSADLTVTVNPAPVPVPDPVPSGNSALTAVWANEGGDKVAREELRATKHVENKTGTVLNRTWDGTTIRLSSARNEVVSFNLVLEAGGSNPASNVSVSFDTVTGDAGFAIGSKAASGNGVFNWTQRNIELFYARYVEIKGLSFFGYYKGDERQIPARFQAASHVWTDRPDHNKSYPDALVPLELVPSFTVAAGNSQSIFADLYVPKSAPPGTYTGSVKVLENGAVTRTIPVSLTVAPFTLPDNPTAKTFVNLDANDIVKRYVDPNNYVQWNGPGGGRAIKITDRYYELFHRHKIGLIGENDEPYADQPHASSLSRLTGSLFTAANGYDGPGVGVGENTFSIGTYGTWGAAQYGIADWHYDQSLFDMHIDAWQNWFNGNLPNTEHFLYLADEPSGAACNGQQYCTDINQVNIWATWANNDPGPGHDLLTMSTFNMVPARTQAPALDIATTAGGIGGCPVGVATCNNTLVSQAAADYYLTTPGKRLWWYNDGRPGSGTFDTEDDGVSPRTIPWAQYKKKIQRWYYWFANVSCCMNPYANALTWGTYNRFDAAIGQTGDDGTSNGNGLIVYPGSDLVNPQDSYGVDGPVASLRMKEYRRGIQDVDYLAIASQIDPATAEAIVQAAIPLALWENPAPGGDISYFQGPISWSVNPDDWEAKRAQLAQIITNACRANPAARYCQ